LGLPARFGSIANCGHEIENPARLLGLRAQYGFEGSANGRVRIDGQDLARPLIEGLHRPRLVDGDDTGPHAADHRRQMVLDLEEPSLGAAQLLRALGDTGLELAALCLHIAPARCELLHHAVEDRRHRAYLVAGPNGQTHLEVAPLRPGHGLHDLTHWCDDDA
jgi:hypothetical protein